MSLLVAAGLCGCGANGYVPAAPNRMRTTVPAVVAIDVLYRRAMRLGYAIESVSPTRGQFAVHSRVFGRGRRTSQPAPDIQPQSLRRSNLFVVEVSEGTVQVSARGRFVRDGRADPALVQELEIFTDAMRRSLAAVESSGLLGGLSSDEPVRLPEPALPTAPAGSPPAPLGPGGGMASALSAP